MTAFQTKRAAHMEGVDRMSAELRQCVHEYGTGIVNALVNNGIRTPAKIHYVVREIWDGPRGWTGHGGAGNKNVGIRSTIDWLLQESGSSMSADTLGRSLWERGYAIVPLEPTTGMIEASASTVSNFHTVVTKSQKHRLRLIAAIDQYVSAHWPRVPRRSLTRSA